MPEVAEQDIALAVQGMDCASCVAHVERAARQLPGVQDCRVNLARGRAVVRIDPAQVSPAQVAGAISASGYQSSVEDQSQSPADREHERLDQQSRHTRAWLRRSMIGVVLWLPVELLHWTHHVLGLHHLPMEWIAVVSSTAALLLVGGGFYVSSYKSLRRGTTNMDVLIAMGATVAYGYSLIAFGGNLLGWWRSLPPLYFMEASGLLALISLGHYLETRARQSAGSAIRELLELAPPIAHRLVSGQPQDVPVEQLAVGDRILIKPGERVPADAVVLEGRSSIDESMLSGEPLPVTRGIGENLVGGTINVDGALQARVMATGAQTALAQIVRLVETAQSAKPPVQRLADRVSAVFVPSVLVIALITGVGWFAWGTAHHWPAGLLGGQIAKAVCSVLIIACPCALGLAVPAALMVGIGRGARHGILIRNIDALEQASDISLVCLDKTGTITRGKPVVGSIHTADGLDEEALLRLAASAEQYSEHPLARAVVAAAQARSLSLAEPTSFSNQPGRGVVADFDQQTHWVGSAALLAEAGAHLTSPEQTSQSSSVHVAVRSAQQPIRYLGRLQINDELKPDSAAAVAELAAMGLKTMLISGDHVEAARAVGDSVGISEIRAGIQPGGKAQVVRELQQQHRVAMVGDGVNDAPALAQADLGFAVGGGSDIAKETGDIVLISGSLKGVPAALRLSRATMRTIRQNLVLAFVYNVLAIPLAAFGLLTPLIAAAAMALSDVTVIGNALLLRRTRIDR